MLRRTYFGIAVILATTAVVAMAQQPPFQPGQPGYPGQPGQQFGFPPPMMMGPATPELAKKMAAIGALREIQNMRMTAKDINTALPLLKELREGEKALETRAGDALEQEKRALLAAGPDTQVPPTTGEKLREANEQFHKQQERVWNTLFQNLGP